MFKLAIKILCICIAGMLLFSLTSCDGGYDSSKTCYIDKKSPAKKFVTDKGTERYYCEDHVTKCSLCENKATKNYTNMLDFHVFVCDEHYEKAN